MRILVCVNVGDCYSMLCKAIASLVEGRGGSGTRFVSLSQHLIKLVQYGHDDILVSAQFI